MFEMAPLPPNQTPRNNINYRGLISPQGSNNNQRSPYGQTSQNQSSSFRAPLNQNASSSRSMTSNPYMMMTQRSVPQYDPHVRLGNISPQQYQNRNSIPHGYNYRQVQSVRGSNFSPPRIYLRGLSRMMNPQLSTPTGTNSSLRGKSDVEVIDEVDRSKSVSNKRNSKPPPGSTMVYLENDARKGKCAVLQFGVGIDLETDKMEELHVQYDRRNDVQVEEAVLKARKLND
ncbi:hypothetical protein ACOME3_006808 [Neoechinorhynchus agilis]